MYPSVPFPVSSSLPSLTVPSSVSFLRAFRVFSHVNYNSFIPYSPDVSFLPYAIYSSQSSCPLTFRRNQISSDRYVIYIKRSRVSLLLVLYRKKKKKSVRYHHTFDAPRLSSSRGFLFLVLIFLSVAGNILVCVAIYTDRGLRRIGNLFLASLAIADLFVGCLVMTFAGVNDLLGYWVFGPRFCDTWIAFDVMCSTASILNLCAISLDRYIHIKDPLRYGRWVTRRVAVAGIAIVWLLAGLISFVPISLGLHRADEPVIYDDGKEEHPTCALDLTLTYAIVSSSISFYVPCIVMLGIYCRLYCYAQKHVKSIRAVTKLPDTSMAKSFRAKSTRNKPPKPQTKTKPTSPYHVSDHKAAITVGVIMGVFLICWVPFFCVNIVASYCKTCISVRAFQVLTWLGYSNSAFNPIIYSIFNTEFREAFKRILTKGARARGNQPSTSECGEFRSVVVQKRNGSMIECNISPRSSADSCQVGIMAQRHRDTIVSAI